MGLLTKLHTAGRASVVAVILAGATLAAMPVEAAPLKGFSLDVKPQGDQKGMQLRNFKNDDNAFFFWCLTDKQIHRGLRAYGFFDIDIVAHLGKNRVRVEAGWVDWYYSFRVNRCSGEVDRIKRLYPAWDDEEDFPF